jgi:hypothetical protein
MNNVAGKIMIVTTQSMMQLKNQSGNFLTHLKRKSVHIGYAHLGMFETVTHRWIGHAHPSIECGDEIKERIEKIMKSEHNTMQCALLPRAFRCIMENNVKMTTRGITLQLMKNEDVAIAKF